MVPSKEGGYLAMSDLAPEMCHELHTLTVCNHTENLGCIRHRCELDINGKIKNFPDNTFCL